MQNFLASDLNHILSFTDNLWGKMRGMRIFLTGGTGFFGLWLLESLIWADTRYGFESEIVVLSRDPHTFKIKNPHIASHSCVSLIEGNVLEDLSFISGPFDYIIHGAAEYEAPIMDNPLSSVDTIVSGTRQVLEFARKVLSGRLLFISSGAVYGRNPSISRRMSENYCGSPNVTDVNERYSISGESKRMGELLCCMYGKCFNLDILIARCFSFVGPYLDLNRHYAIGNFIRDGLSGKPIEIKSDGSEMRSYLYAADLAIWLWNILIYGKSGQSYNVGSDRAISIAEVGCLVSKCFETPPQVIIGKPDIRKKKHHYVPSIKKAEKELGLREWVGLEDAIRKTIDWNRAIWPGRALNIRD